MNLVQQSEQLKNLPDAALLQMQQRPTTVPPYLVVAEMQRRETMRKAAQDQGGQNPMDRKTVSQEMVGQMQQQAMAPPPQQMQGGMGAMKMAGGGHVPRWSPSSEGGLAALAGQLEAPSILEGEMGPFQVAVPGGDQMMGQPSMFPRKPGGPAMTLADLFAQHGPEVDPSDEFNSFKKMRGESRLNALAESLASQEKELRGRKPKLGETLMQLGLAMASSRNPSFLGALADGGVGASQGYTQDRNRREGQADELQRRRIGIIGQLDNNDDQMMGRAVESARSKNGLRGQEIQALQASLRQQEGQIFDEREHNSNRDLQWKIAEAKLKFDDALAKANTQEKKEAATVDFNRDMQKLQFQAANRGGGGGGDDFAKITARYGALNRAAQDAEENALKAEKAYEATTDKAMRAAYLNYAKAQRADAANNKRAANALMGVPQSSAVMPDNGPEALARFMASLQDEKSPAAPAATSKQPAPPRVIPKPGWVRAAPEPTAPRNAVPLQGTKYRPDELPPKFNPNPGRFSQ